MNLSPEERAALIRGRVHLRNGELYWSIRGGPIKSATDKWGYKYFAIRHPKGSHHFFVHRVIWLLSHGSWPVGEIDHANRIKADNRIENLRDVTRSENERNKARRPSYGITWHKRKKAWEVRPSRNTYCGCFKNRDDAVAARDAAVPARVSFDLVRPA